MGLPLSKSKKTFYQYLIKIETIWIPSCVPAPAHCAAYDSMMEILYFCKYFNQWQYSLVMLTVALYCYWLKGTVKRLISCSWHQSTKQPILFSPIFPMNFSQIEQLKKETNFSLVQNWGKTCFGPMKSLFSFSTAQTEKNSWEKLEKTRLVVWGIDVPFNHGLRTPNEGQGCNHRGDRCDRSRS